MYHFLSLSKRPPGVRCISTGVEEVVRAANLCLGEVDVVYDLIAVENIAAEIVCCVHVVINYDLPDMSTALSTSPAAIYSPAYGPAMDLALDGSHQ